jgi:hypothetical protein
MRVAAAYFGLMLAAAVLVATGEVLACVGAECLQIRSSEAGGGALTIRYDFSRKVQTFLSFCTPDRSQCLYTTIDPGFMAESTPGEQDHPLLDGTTVRVEIVSADPGLSMSVNGVRLQTPGSSANLGTMPNIHVHPSWQLLVPGEEVGDYRISYKLTTESPAYGESVALTSIVTNAEPPPGSPTPTPRPTPTRPPCGGDCDLNAEVSIDELVRGVAIALGSVPLDECRTLDANADGAVSVDELVRAVDASLNGCARDPLASFVEIQRTIFTPRCAIPTCHDAVSATGNLVLAEGVAYGQLVNVPPDIEAAAIAGFLRVAPGEPERSFLLMKVEEPPPGQGSRMPLGDEPLSAEETQLIRDWIEQGAAP